MAQTPETPYVDMQIVNDEMALLYEAVATLEYHGRAPSRSAIAAATKLPEADLDQDLASLTEVGMLQVNEDEEEPVYVPSRRGWSVEPGLAEGQKLE